MPVLGIHAVLGALGGRKPPLHRILIERGRGGPKIREIFDRARRSGVPVVEVDRDRLDRLSAGGRHQGVAALAAASPYSPIEDLLGACVPEGRLLLLDRVEDPRNLGAVIRTAAAVGARGVVVPEHRAAGLTPGAVRAAAGALGSVGVARCRNVADLVRELREDGFWVAGLDASGEMAWDRVQYPGRMALVVGGESRGLRPRVREACDVRISIPLSEGVESLNLSVAAAVVLYEALRQDRASGKG